MTLSWRVTKQDNSKLYVLSQLNNILLSCFGVSLKLQNIATQDSIYLFWLLRLDPVSEPPVFESPHEMKFEWEHWLPADQKMYHQPVMHKHLLGNKLYSHINVDNQILVRHISLWPTMKNTWIWKKSKK